MIICSLAGWDGVDIDTYDQDQSKMEKRPCTGWVH